MTTTKCIKSFTQKAKASAEAIPGTNSLKTHDNKIEVRFDQSIVMETRFRQLRALSYSKSLPTRLHLFRTDDNVRRLQSLNENYLSQRRDRSKTFAASPICWHKQPSPTEHKFPHAKVHKTDAKKYDRYSPKVTKTLTCNNPIELFQQQYGITEADVMFGRVKFMFQYFNKDKQFLLTLLRVTNVAKGTASPLRVYAKIQLIPGKGQKRVCRHKYNSSNPVFNEQFHFQISLGKLMESTLRIQLYNKPGIFSVSKPLGTCTIDLSKYDLTTVTVMWKELRKDVCQEIDDCSLKHNKGRSGRRLKSLLCLTKY